MTYEKIMVEINDLRDKIEKERDQLMNFSIFLNSLKTVYNYLQTGKPYSEEDYAY